MMNNRQYIEKMMELNSEFIDEIRLNRKHISYSMYDLLFVLGEKEAAKEYERIWDNCFLKLGSGSAFDDCRIFLYEFFKSNEDKIPYWIELLKMKSL